MYIYYNFYTNENKSFLESFLISFSNISFIFYFSSLIAELPVDVSINISLCSAILVNTFIYYPIWLKLSGGIDNILFNLKNVEDILMYILSKNY